MVAASRGQTNLPLLTSRGLQNAPAVVLQHLHAVGAPIGKQVGVVRACCAEDRHHTGQYGFGARSHDQPPSERRGLFDVALDDHANGGDPIRR